MKIALILYESLISQKCDLPIRLYGKHKKFLFENVKLWNILLPCLISDEKIIIEYTIFLLNEYFGTNETTEFVVEDFDSLYQNKKASLMLYMLISQINIEINNSKIDTNKVDMLIRACHNLPRCMINGNMYATETQCIDYSIMNMNDDIKQVIKLFV